ncbi:MAG: histidine kinase [Candidatus Kapabacteria bacterium]|nr:histidine kinase [Candidatus Kapabacteria bacterium]
MLQQAVRISAIIVILQTVFCMRADAGVPSSFRTTFYGKAEGLPHNVVNCLYQDSRGYIWIGTTLGLTRFDGYEFKVYRRRSNDTITTAATIVTCITEDKQGNIWVGSQSEGLFRLQRRTGVWTRFTPESGSGLDESHITALACDSSGRVWVGTPSGLVRYNSTSNKFEDIAITTPYRSIFALYAHNAATMLFATGGNTVCAIDIASGVQRIKVLPVTLGFPHLTWFHRNSAEEFTVSATAETPLNIARVNLTSLTVVEMPAYPPIRQTGDSLLMMKPMMQETSGRLWFGIRTLNTAKSVTLAPHYTVPFLPTDSLKRSSSYNVVSQFLPVRPEVRCMTADRTSKGVYWCGTAQGLVKIVEQEQRVTTIRKNPLDPTSLNDNYVRSTCTTPRGTTYIATTTGLNILDGNTVKNLSVTLIDSIMRVQSKSFRVNIIYNDPDGGILVATNSGLYRLDEEKRILRDCYTDSVETVGGFSPIWKRRYPQKVWSLLRDNAGTLWIGTNGDGLYEWKRGAAHAIRHTMKTAQHHSLSDNRVWSLFQDISGILWVGTEGGLARWDATRREFRTYKADINKPYTLCGNNVWTITADAKKRMLVMCYGDGISIYRPATDDFESVSVSDGLPTTSLTGLINDGDANIWATSYDGVVQFRLGSNLFRVLRASDGFQGDEYTFKCVERLPDGRMLFGGYNGLTLFYPRDLQSYGAMPPVVISRFDINGIEQRNEVQSGDTIELSHTQNSISFIFAALNYANSLANRYQHYMHGVESGWLNDEYRRTASYANLQPGTYTLHIRAANSDDVWNDAGLSITVIINPPWWGTWWARIMAFLLVLGGVGAGVFFYVRTKTRRAEQRRALVASQMQSLRAQMNPHFMFNALNSVQRLILEGDVDNAVRALGSFAKLVRASLESTIHPVHSLKTEVDWLRLYLDLEQLRYGSKLNYTITVAPDVPADELTVPSMIVQPFVENSIRHGIFHKTTPGTVTVEFSVNSGALHCIIRDDGVGRAAAREKTRLLNLPTTSVGITSTTERVGLLNEDRKASEHISVMIDDLHAPDGSASGTKVTIRFPLDRDG